MTDLAPAINAPNALAGTGVDPLMQHWRAIGASYARNHRRLIHVVEEYGVQAEWFEVLIKLLESPGRRQTMSRLAAGVTITSGGLTKLIDRLEQAGFAERQNDPLDRRIVHAALTPAGVRAAEGAVAAYSRELHATVPGPVSAQEVARTGEWMARLTPAANPL